MLIYVMNNSLASNLDEKFISIFIDQQVSHSIITQSNDINTKQLKTCNYYTHNK